VGQDDKRYISGEPGLGKEGSEYLASKEVVAVGADSWGLEVIPFEPGLGVSRSTRPCWRRNAESTS
jgi:kynurenine formamidase